MARDLSWLTARPIAHRGLHNRAGGIIENTASAFAGAMAGHYAIECDLQITRDGEAVVFHDETLDRLTEAAGQVKEFTAGQVKQMTIRGSPDRVQTLDEMLQQVAGKVPLVIEIKSHWDGSEVLALRALEVLRSYAGLYCLMSFDPDIIAAVRRLSPGTPRGIVADRATDNYYNPLPMKRRVELRSLSHLTRTRPDFISVYFRDLPWAPVAAFRAAGHPVISWTIRSAAQAADARRYTDQITFEHFAA